jgi:hypothetical protein
MVLDLRMRRIVSLVVVIVLVAFTIYLLLGPLKDEGIGVKIIAVAVILLGFGSMVLVPLWREHSKWASYRYYQEDRFDDVERRDLSDDMYDIVEKVIDVVDDERE